MKDYIWALVIVTALSFILGYKIHRPEQKTVTNTVEVEKVVTPKEMADSKKLFLCYEDAFDHTPESCQKYEGTVMVEGQEYYKVKYRDDKSIEIRAKDKNLKLYYIQQTNLK